MKRMFLVLALLCFGATAQAATVIEGQKIVGGAGSAPTPAIAAVHDIIAGGFRYNLDFFYDSAFDLFGFESSTGLYANAPASVGAAGLSQQILTIANDAINTQTTLTSFTNRDKNGVLPLGGGAGIALLNYRVPVSSIESTNFSGTFLAENLYVTNGVSGFATNGGLFTTIAGENRVYGVISQVAPVPLPASVFLLMVGLGGLVQLRRLRKD